MNATTTQSHMLTSPAVLTIDLSKPIVDKLSDNMADYLSFPSFEFSPPLSLYSSVEALKMAAIDPNIKGIYIKIPLLTSPSQSTLYELREALEEFKRTAPDKFIISYGNAYDQSAVYLSSVADDVYLHPMGGVAWVGMSATTTFYTGTLDKLGIEPQIIRVGTFKSAVEPFTLKKMSAENRNQLQSIIDSHWEFMVEQVAQSRNRTTEELEKAATDIETFNAEGALKTGLVDSLLYVDQVEDIIAKRIGAKSPHTISLQNYAQQYPPSTNLNGMNRKVQVIVASGEIVEEGMGSGGIVGTELAKQIAAARKDSSVKAIVLRVDSPGGSAIASDEIYREVQLAVETKPLIISMGAYAASGGYWIAAPATKIVANPMTLTGSIGVFGMLFNLQEGAENILGLSFDEVKTNPSADMGSLIRPLSTLERQRIQQSINQVYERFVTLVSDNRGMTTQGVDSIAQGRVWTGLQGLEKGLVDEIGTLQTAIKIAAKEANIEDNYSVYSTRAKDQEFFDLLMSSSASLLKTIMPSVFDDEIEALLKQLDQKQGTSQARLPFNVEIH